MDERQPNFGNSKIIRHPIEEWESYEVKKEELDHLEKGDQNDLFLELGIAAGSVAASFFIAWLPLDFDKDKKIYEIYIIVWIVLLVAFIILIIVYLKGKRSTKEIFKAIRSRKAMEKYT